MCMFGNNLFVSLTLHVCWCVECTRDCGIDSDVSENSILCKWQAKMIDSSKFIGVTASDVFNSFNLLIVLNCYHSVWVQ